MLSDRRTAKKPEPLARRKPQVSTKSFTKKALSGPLQSLDLGVMPHSSSTRRPPPKPLQELSQEQVNAPSPSPPKQKQPFQQADENEDPSVDEPAPAGFDGAASECSGVTGNPDNSSVPEAVHTSISMLLAAKEASVHHRTSAPELGGPRRRKGLLGRNASGISNSTSSALSTLDAPPAPPPPQTQPESQAASQSQRLWLQQSESQDKFNKPLEDVLPSQKIIYEDAEMRDQRERMIRRLGGRVEENTLTKSEVTKKMGVVRDTVGDGTVGNRVRKRRFG
jgi:hypothetical protein